MTSEMRDNLLNLVSIYMIFRLMILKETSSIAIDTKLHIFKYPNLSLLCYIISI